MQQRVKKYEPLAIRHRIPIPTHLTGKDFFCQIIDKNKDEPYNSKEFDHLSQKEQKSFTRLAKNKNVETNKDFKSFLNRIKLNQKRYN